MSKRPEAGDERLFAKELGFIHWLAELLRTHPDFSDVALEPMLPSVDRPARADIIAEHSTRGKRETLIIECKNTPVLLGDAITNAIAQLRRYGALRPGSKLVLALPSRLTEDDAARVVAAGIDLWDIDAIRRIFAEQIRTSASAAAKILRASDRVSRTSQEILAKQLKECVPGRVQWSLYQRLIGRALEELFCPPLQAPISESADEPGINRRDFVLANFAEAGFWQYMRMRYNADYVVVDAKNYRGKVKKRDVLHVAHYLKRQGAGLFGIIFSRNGGDRSAKLTARDYWIQDGKLVVILDDSHLEAMLVAKSAAGDPTFVLAAEIQQFRLSI
jgi:hypothetical protein